MASKDTSKDISPTKSRPRGPPPPPPPAPGKPPVTKPSVPSKPSPAVRRKTQKKPPVPVKNVNNIKDIVKTEREPSPSNNGHKELPSDKVTEKAVDDTKPTDTNAEIVDSFVVVVKDVDNNDIAASASAAVVQKDLDNVTSKDTKVVNEKQIADSEKPQEHKKRKRSGGTGILANFKSRFSNSKEDNGDKKKKERKQSSSEDKKSKQLPDSRSMFYVADVDKTAEIKDTETAESNVADDNDEPTTKHPPSSPKKKMPELPPKSEHRKSNQDPLLCKGLTAFEFDCDLLQPSKPSKPARKKRILNLKKEEGDSDFSSSENLHAETIAKKDDKNDAKESTEESSSISSTSPQREVVDAGKRQSWTQKAMGQSFTTEDMDLFNRKSRDLDEEESSVTTTSSSTVQMRTSRTPTSPAKKDRRRSKSVGAPGFQFGVKLKPVARPSVPTKPSKPPPPIPSQKPTKSVNIKPQKDIGTKSPDSSSSKLAGTSPSKSMSSTPSESTSSIPSESSAITPNESSASSESTSTSLSDATPPTISLSIPVAPARKSHLKHLILNEKVDRAGRNNSNGTDSMYDNCLDKTIPAEEIYSECLIETPSPTTDDFYEEIEFPSADETMEKTEEEKEVEKEESVEKKDTLPKIVTHHTLTLPEESEPSAKVRRKVSRKASRKLTRKLTQRIKDRKIDERFVKSLLREESVEVASDEDGDGLDFSDTDSEWDEDEFSDDSDLEWEQEMLSKLEMKMNSQMPDDEESKRPEHKLKRIAGELLSTEIAYVDRLHLVDQVFHFKVIMENRTHNMFPADIVPQIFSNIKSIYQFHNEFLLPPLKERLEQWEENPRIGDIMKRLAPFLKMYSEYVKNFDHSMSVFNEWQVKSPRFHEIIQAIQATEQCHRLTLQHHMLEPVQRVPRYEMLLKDYLKRLPPDSDDLEDTKKALELVSTAASHSNEAMTKIEKFRKMLEINESLGGAVDLTSPTRELRREGRITKISPRNGAQQERYIFLFNDMLLLCQGIAGLTIRAQYRIRNKMDIEGMQVLEGDNLELTNTFYVKSKKKTIELHCPSIEEKSEWQVALWSVIGEYVKKQMSRNVELLRENFQDNDLGKRAPKWIKDQETTMCMICSHNFTMVRRRHHCRACGIVICGKCSTHKAPLPYDDNQSSRVCDKCYVGLMESGDEISSPSLLGNHRRRAILQKKAQEKGLKSGYMHMSLDKKTWTRRYFVVHKDFVLYSYKAHQDVTALTSMPLPGYVASEAEEKDALDRGMVLKLSHPQQKTYYFQTDNDNSVYKRWLYVLTCVTNAELPSDNPRDVSLSAPPPLSPMPQL